MSDEQLPGSPAEGASTPPAAEPATATPAAAPTAADTGTDQGRKPWKGRPVPRRGGWRQVVLTRIATLELELRQLECRRDSDCDFDATLEQILKFLETAQLAAESKTRWGSGAYWSGNAPDQAWLAVHAAEEALLPLQDNETLRGKASTIIAWGSLTLGARDPRVTEVSDLVKRASSGNQEIDAVTRQRLKSMLRSANDESDSSYASSRSFRNLVLIASLVAAFIGVLIAVLGIWWAEAAPLCDANVCPIATHSVPTGLDVAAVELFGVLGAVLAVAFSLRRLRGTRNPYGIGLVQGLLKIPLGALTGFTGVLIVQSGLISGIVKPGSAGQVVAYAVVFGYSQQLLTSLVDKQAQTVVHGTSGERTTSGAGTTAAN